VLYRVYVDEAGDRGFSAASSRHFVVSAVIVPDATDARLRSELAALRSALKRHSGHALHFVKFNHSQRLKAAQEIANSSLAAVVNVVIYKDLIGQPPPAEQTSYIARPDPMYLWALRLLLERISWYADENDGDDAIVTFGQLKGFGSKKLHDYRNALEVSSEVEVRWRVFDGHPYRIDNPKTVELLQVADITASSLFRAVEPDVYGNTEPRYLGELGPKLYRRAGESVTTCGLKTFPDAVSEPGGPLAFLRDF